jgi:hypothetical protein
MAKIKKVWFAGLLGFVALTGCSAVQVSAKETSDARHLYLTKCAKCHEFYPPQNYSKLEWDKWMLKMRKKARLNDAQFQQLKEYTETLRSGGK